MRRSSRVAQQKRDREIIRRGFLLPLEDPQMCKCLSVFVPPDLSCKCYTDCLHFVCILTNRIGVTKERSRRVGFCIRINKPSVLNL